MSIDAPGGASIADVPAQVGDVSFVIDAFLGFASEAGTASPLASMADRIALAGHSGGALTTLVTAYDQNLRERRHQSRPALRAAVLLLQAGYFDGRHRTAPDRPGRPRSLVDAAGDAGAIFARAQSPQGTPHRARGQPSRLCRRGRWSRRHVHLPLFPESDISLRPDRRDPGGARRGRRPRREWMAARAPTVRATPRTSTASASSRSAKQAALAFFEDVLRGDAAARRYLDSLPARNPDLSLTVTR